MCLVEELQRISGQKLKDVLAICIRYLVGRSTFELKVIKPGACRFDYIATQAGAEQRWHAGKWLPDQKEGGSRIFSKEARESDQCCVAAPRNTTRYTTRNTTRYTARNTTELLAGAAFWSFEAFKERNENTSQLFLS